eukprot:142262_1
MPCFLCNQSEIRRQRKLNGIDKSSTPPLVYFLCDRFCEAVCKSSKKKLENDGISLRIEISTPFKNLRYLMIKWGYSKSILFRISEMIFICSFFYLRLIVG